ncbi:hypothetical protein AIOGIFDO_01900 [Candidatus Methanoperedenaceae archaeon GB37]|nr:hypothetical protein AIOGIFDO_01900 [Candidatus Methanoperedenaceae archaeon GB37]
MIEEVPMPVDTRDLLDELRGVKSQESLLTVLKRWAERYSIFEIVRLQGFTAKEMENLHPAAYREELLRKHGEWLITTLKEIRSARPRENGAIDFEEYSDFMKHVIENMSRVEDSAERDALILHTLCALYKIFIAKAPVHMVGTPFPGGFRVQKIGEEYFCPVKEKQKDVPGALCRFCVAKQL